MTSHRKPSQTSHAPPCPPVLLYPFAGCEPEGQMNKDQQLLRLRQLRQKVREHLANPGLRALVELQEIRAAGMQMRAIHPTGNEHERGQAYGAGQMVALVRDMLRTVEDADEEEEGEGNAGARRRGGRGR